MHFYLFILLSSSLMFLLTNLNHNVAVPCVELLAFSYPISALLLFCPVVYVSVSIPPLSCGLSSSLRCPVVSQLCSSLWGSCSSSVWGRRSSEQVRSFSVCKLCHVSRKKSTFTKLGTSTIHCFSLCGVQPSDQHSPVISWVMVSCFS